MPEKLARELPTPPIIEMRLRSMEHSIAHHLGEYESEIQEAIQQGVKRVFAEFDFRGEIDHHIRRFLSNELYKTIDVLAREVFYARADKLLRPIIKEAFDKVLPEQQA